MFGTLPVMISFAQSRLDMQLQKFEANVLGGHMLNEQSGCRLDAKRALNSEST